MYRILGTKEKTYEWEKACYSNYGLILSKQTFFNEKISAKQKRAKQTDIDRKLQSHVTAVMVVFITSSKII